jgi:hypothetical protein
LVLSIPVSPGLHLVQSFFRIIEPRYAFGSGLSSPDSPGLHLGLSHFLGLLKVLSNEN